MMALDAARGVLLDVKPCMLGIWIGKRSKELVSYCWWVQWSMRVNEVIT